MTSAQNLSVVDLFCGAGLMSGGFQAEGFQPILGLDLSADAIASYRRNIAPVAVKGCVRTWPEIPQADVLIAGPPCQGFSTLGRQDPKDDRNKLALEVARWAEATRALIVVVENVPPFVSSAQGQRLRSKLRAQGYDVFVWVLEAADYGTAQFRRRAFTIASKIGRFDAPQPSGTSITAGSILGLPTQACDPMHRWPTPVGIASERIALIPPGGDKRDILRIAPHLCPQSWVTVGCHATDVWGRIKPHLPANTIRCTFQNPSKGRYLHPIENRTISLREAARLQGVPDQWIFEGKNYSVARQIGNGVPVTLARAVASSIRDALFSVNMNARAA